MSYLGHHQLSSGQKRQMEEILQKYWDILQFGQNEVLGSCLCHKLSAQPSGKVEPLRSARMFAELKVTLS